MKRPKPLNPKRPPSSSPQSSSTMATSTLRRSLRNPKLLSQSQSQSQLISSPSPPFPSFRAAKLAIITERDPTKLTNLFLSQSSSFPAFTHHRPIYHLTIRKLTKANRPDLIEHIITSHLSSTPDISEGFFVRLLMLYSSAGMLDHAHRLFSDLAPRFTPSEKPLCAMLTALLDNNEFDRFHRVFNSARGEAGVKACNLKLRAYCEEGKVELARELLGKGMDAADIHSYNVVLGACLKGKDMVEFDSLVKEFLRKGLEPNVTTYNLRIARLCKDKECARARKLLDEMLSKDVSPNAASYNTIIDGFCRVGDLESAKMVLEKMVKDGYVKPSSLTYYTLFRCMVREGEFESGLDMCKEILKRKWVPPFEAMEGLVKGLVGLSKKEEATEIVEKMKKKLQGPAAESWGKIEAALPL